MDSFKEVLSRAKEAWRLDRLRNVNYIVLSASSLPRARSNFEILNNTDNLNYLTCGKCGSKMLLVAQLDLQDDDYLSSVINEISVINIHVCTKRECRDRLYMGLDNEWATYHWRGNISDKQISVSNGDAWLSVSTNSQLSQMSATLMQSDQYGFAVEVASDIIDPSDFGWYPGDGSGSHAQAILNQIQDLVIRDQLYRELIRDFPRWYAPKFGGYPHWRSLQMDAGCECSMKGTLVFTFDNSICPSLCPEGVSAWLFVCKYKPLTHSASIIFQRDPSQEHLLGLYSGVSLLPL